MEASSATAHNRAQERVLKDTLNDNSMNPLHSIFVNEKSSEAREEKSGLGSEFFGSHAEGNQRSTHR